MTGSDSITTPCKGTGRPSLQQQREAGKTELDTTDQLRRLAIKNSCNTKSLPGSPLPSRAAGAACSSSTSSLNKIPAIPSITIQNQPAGNYSAAALLDCKLPPLPQSSNSTTTERVQPTGPSGHQKSNPYITRQELLHSLRRTCSNFSVGVTQTTCSGSSSYVHYTPRHLNRTNFNPRPTLSHAATPDSGLGESELSLGLVGDEGLDGESYDSQETRSMVDMPQQQRRPSRASSLARNLRGASPGLHYRSVEVPAENRQRHVSQSAPRDCMHVCFHVTLHACFETAWLGGCQLVMLLHVDTKQGSIVVSTHSIANQCFCIH